MSKHALKTRTPAPRVKHGVAFKRPVSRSPFSLAIVAFAAAVGFVAVTAVDPYSGAVASPYYRVPERAAAPSQAITVGADYDNSFTRDGYEVIDAPVVEPDPPADESSAADTVQADSVGAGEPQAPQAPPAVAVPDPGTAQAIAFDMVAQRGWSTDEYSCLVSLWNKESGWNVAAHNAGSGAYGIPQALPGSKMASAGGDWQTNPATQITWGLGYITGRYGSPCGAWAHSQAVNWY